MERMWRGRRFEVTVHPGPPAYVELWDVTDGPSGALVACLHPRADHFHVIKYVAVGEEFEEWAIDATRLALLDAGLLASAREPCGPDNGTVGHS
jgi:hypothetical protein